MLSRVKVAVRSHACWTFSSTRAPPSLSRLPISAPRLANRDGQPYTGPGFARINSNVTLAAPRRAAAFASETRNVPGSRSCGPSRSQIGRRLLRTRAAARPSVGRLSSATSKKVNSGSAASTKAGYAACGSSPMAPALSPRKAWAPPCFTAVASGSEPAATLDTVTTRRAFGRVKVSEVPSSARDTRRRPTGTYLRSCSCKSVGLSLRAVDLAEDLVGVFGPGEGPGWSFHPSMKRRWSG